MSRTISLLPTAAVAITAAVTIAACGSTSPTASTSSTSSSATASGGHLSYAQAQQDAVAFAGCMRSHGVPSFPDPSSPANLKQSINSSTAHSPAFQPAAAACRHLLPGGGSRNQTEVRTPAQRAALLAFARCLRGHGLPGFPDPTSTGDLTHEMLAQAGIDVHDPAVVQDADACVSVTHGMLTKASVARFAAGQ